MRKSANKRIIAVFGEGGHESQMCRLMCSIKDELEYEVIAITDSGNNFSWASHVVNFQEIRNKYNNKVSSLKNIVSFIKVLNKIDKKYEIKSIVSTGPGCSIIVTLYFKLIRKCKIIHIETWSRFYSKSLTGRFMYYLADIFYVQNKELLTLYPKGVFSGRL